MIDVAAGMRKFCKVANVLTERVDRNLARKKRQPDFTDEGARDRGNSPIGSPTAAQRSVYARNRYFS
jgi:hypothetical protein